MATSDLTTADPNAMLGLGKLGFGRQSYGDLIRQIIAGKGTGRFAPGFLRELARRRAMMGARNSRQRGGTLARLLSLDPSQSRAAIAQNEIGAGHETARALNEADLAGSQQEQSLIEHLLGSERGMEYQTQERRAQEREARKGAFGGFLGQVVGAAVPGVVGAATRPRQPRQYQPTDYYGPEYQ